MAVGILGGVFDPPHVGHVALARAAVSAFALDELLVLVVGDPGHKTTSTPAETRLELVRLAFEDVPEAVVELDHHAPHRGLARGTPAGGCAVRPWSGRARRVRELEVSRACSRARAPRGRDASRRLARGRRRGPRRGSARATASSSSTWTRPDLVLRDSRPRCSRRARRRRRTSVGRRCDLAPRSLRRARVDCGRLRPNY